MLPIALSRKSIRRKVHLTFSPPGSTQELHQKAVLLQISEVSSSSLEFLLLLDAGLYSNLGKKKRIKEKENNFKNRKEWGKNGEKNC